LIAAEMSFVIEKEFNTSRLRTTYGKAYMSSNLFRKGMILFVAIIGAKLVLKRCNLMRWLTIF
jgi:hypothetical protein